MAEKPIPLTMANPVPEIMPDEARLPARRRFVGTGRSDFPNQINNVLAFPASSAEFDVRSQRHQR